MWRTVLDFFFPPFCLVCGGAPGVGRGLVCETCWDWARRESRTPFFIDDEGVGASPREGSLYGRSANRWNEPLGEILHRFKYGSYASLGERLGLALAATLSLDPRLREADLLVPVPLTRARRAERGYNQSEILARRLSKLTGIRCAPHVVARRGRSRSQTKLDPVERRKNVRGVFRVRRPDLVAGRRIVIVDDVITTGATAWELARTLRAAGARELSVLSVARASGRSSPPPRSSSSPEGRPPFRKKRSRPAIGSSTP